MISENDIKRNNKSVKEAVKHFDKLEYFLDPDFAKEELNKTIEEHKSLDIPIYKGPTGKERRRARRKGKKAHFKVASKVLEPKSSKFVCRSLNHFSKFRS